MELPAAAAGIVGPGVEKPADGIAPERIATALYRVILGREPDPPGLQDKTAMLRAGESLERVMSTFVDSPEFRSRFLNALLPQTSLPNLVAMMPDRYEKQPVGGGYRTVYLARDDADIAAMAAAIDTYRYYDCLGVWSPVIDLDKQVTAAIVRGLGARSCFELGCFTGAVLSLLAEMGIAVAGAEISHAGFTFAYPAIRNALLFGDLLRLQIARIFDVVLCMDVLEHLNPLLLDRYIERLLSILDRDGYIYLNTPMWGSDRMFGVLEAPYLAEWHKTGDSNFWRHWPCEPTGWPSHGHLIWASPRWWEGKFAQHGLVRDIPIESAIHRVLGPFFDLTPGRRCLFVLRRPDSCRASDAGAAAVAAALQAVPNLPQQGGAAAQSQG